jgi:hypothetical protein
MAEPPARPPLDWSGNAPFPFTRESSIRIDEGGRFWHEGNVVEHPGLATAMASWVSKHPTDGRWVLENGYDWCWITVDDVPLFVRDVRVDGDELKAKLSDGSEESLDLDKVHVDAAGTIRCEVKPGARGGPYPAKLLRVAQLALAERLREEDGRIVLDVGARSIDLAKR